MPMVGTCEVPMPPMILAMLNITVGYPHGKGMLASRSSWEQAHAERQWMRGMPEGGAEMGRAAHVPDLRARRLLRLKPGPARRGPFQGNRPSRDEGVPRGQVVVVLRRQHVLVTRATSAHALVKLADLLDPELHLVAPLQKTPARHADAGR